MKIDVTIEGLSQIEDNVDVALWIWIGVWSRADDVAAQSKCLMEQVFCSRLIGDAFLSKDSELKREAIGVCFFNRKQCLDRSKLKDRVDFYVAADSGDAKGDRIFNYSAGPSLNVFDGEPLF